MTTNDVAIVDYKLNNTRSVFNSIQKIGYQPNIIRNPKELTKAKKIILPGVGAFDVAMKVLVDDGWAEELNNCISKHDIPTLGICLGMQLLSNNSTEGKKSNGLSFIKGSVRKINPKAYEKIPHIGWNSVIQLKKSELFNEIPDRSNFYFVHSYKFEVSKDTNKIGETPFADGFCSVVNNSNVFGVQFHPEKSSKYGLKLLKNFIEIC